MPNDQFIIWIGQEAASGLRYMLHFQFEAQYILCGTSLWLVCNFIVPHTLAEQDMLQFIVQLTCYSWIGLEYEQEL